MEKSLAVFETTHETMRAEKAFKEARIKVRATIKPRKISSNCQMALEFQSKMLADIKMVVKKNSLKLTGYFKQAENSEWEEE